MTLDMTTALAQQTVITGQIAERLAAVPTNQDFVRLLEATHAHTNANDIIIEQMTRIMTYLAELRGHVEAMGHASQQTQHFADNEEQPPPPEQPRVWDAFGEAWRQAPPTPLGETSLPTTPTRHESMSEIEMRESAETGILAEPRPSHGSDYNMEEGTMRERTEQPAEGSNRGAEAVELPTPRRLPLAYAPGAVVANPAQTLRNASRSSQSGESQKGECDDTL